MLRSLALLSALAFTACAAPSAEETGYGGSNLITGERTIGETVTLSGDGVRLRTGPATSRTAIAALYKGTQVKLLAAEEGAAKALPTDGFYKVEVVMVPEGQAAENVGKQGWVSSQYLDGTEAPAPEPEEVEEAESCAGANANRAAAKDLGELTDFASARTRVNVQDEQVGAGERWYRMVVKDEGFNGDPQVQVTLSDESLEATVFFVCAGEAGTSSTCDVGTETSLEGLKGCAGERQAQLSTSCENTNDETGVAVVRVKKKTPSATCASYTLSVFVF